MRAISIDSKDSPLIAVTSGEPAGIGPELCALLATQRVASRFVVIGDRHLLEERAQRIDVRCTTREYDSSLPKRRASRELLVRHVPLRVPAQPGRLDPANSAYVLETLRLALDGCMTGAFDGIATAPVHKGIINDAGIPFTGHTEYFAERSRAPTAVMMLVGGGMRVALATTHLAIKDVANAITRPTLEHVVRTLIHDLTARFGIAHPRIAVAGLNPHAGESGHLGREEVEVITPVIEAMRAAGHDLVGPLAADTLFNRERLQHYDCVLAMYHDQGLPVLKYASFGSAVNVTLGLPVIRTSVDHGTALELAGTGKAEVGSLLAAIDLAAMLARGAKKRAVTP